MNLPLGITNSFKEGAIIYYCPFCKAESSDKGIPHKSEDALKLMRLHVMYQHGEDGRKPQ